MYLYIYSKVFYVVGNDLIKLHSYRFACYYLVQFVFLSSVKKCKDYLEDLDIKWRTILSWICTLWCLISGLPITQYDAENNECWL